MRLGMIDEAAFILTWTMEPKLTCHGSATFTKNRPKYDMKHVESIQGYVPRYSSDMNV